MKGILGYNLDALLCFKVMERKYVLHNIEKARELHLCGQNVAVVYPMICEIDTIMILPDCYYFHRQRRPGEIASYISDPLFFRKLYQCTSI